MRISVIVKCDVNLFCSSLESHYFRFLDEMAFFEEWQYVHLFS